MQALRRTAASATRKTPRTTLPRQPRRYAHDEHAHAHTDAHGQPVNEPIGSAFWITVGLIPTGWALYALSNKTLDDKSIFTSLINKYSALSEHWSDLNALHADAIETAARDRLLFMGTKPQDFVDLKFPEIMNVGSPYNVPAGSQVNLDKVIEQYRKQAAEEDEQKREALRNGTISSEIPFEKHSKVGKLAPNP